MAGVHSLTSQGFCGGHCSGYGGAIEPQSPSRVNDLESKKLGPTMQCEAVLRELSNYIDGAVSPDLHRKMKDHFQGCESCTAMLESTRSVVQALNDDRMVDVPPGYSERLYDKLNAQLGGAGGVAQPPTSNARIPLGIANDQVELGSHLIHFWENDEEFARGVRFLEPGLSGNDHCVVFGNDEVTARVFRQLDARGFDTDVTSAPTQNHPASPGVFRLHYTVRY